MNEDREQVSISVRLASGLVERLEKLAARLSTDPAMAPRGRLTRVELLRLAVVRGVAELEREADERRL